MYDDDRDALAAEYVLGTLSADERDQAEALLVIDPGFAEIVRVWERRLGELNVMVEAVEPPPDLWDKIKTGIVGAERSAAKVEAVLPAIEQAVTQTVPEALAELPQEPGSEPAPDLPSDLDESSPVAALASSLLPPEPQPDIEAQRPSAPAIAAPAPRVERNAEVVYLARQARRWRGITVAMTAVAALLAIYVAVGQFAPSLIPLGRQTPAAAPAQAPGPRLVAVLQQEPTAPAFLLTVDPRSRIMTVRRMTAAADPGRSYELWSIASASAKPRSLGLVGAEPFTTRPLPADFDAGAMQGSSYAVSLEPAGGSPSGVPTGPILFTGRMVESLPGSPS